MRKKIIFFSVLSLTLFSTVLLFFSGERENKCSVSAHNFFNNENQFINFVEKEIKFDNMKLRTVSIEKGDNFWKLAKRYEINIDTLIGANPFWKNLFAKVNQKVVVPSRKGILHFIDNTNGIDELCKIYNCDKKNILVQELPFMYSFVKRMKNEYKPVAVFVLNEKPKPLYMTDKLASQFKIREMFRSPIGGRYSSFFGKRRHPIFRRQQFHNGLDIAAKHGTPIGASCSGRVTASGWMGGYGKAVIIQHRDGYRTLYGHMSSINARKGQHVKKGQFIGRVGSTGLSTGPHLHFTLWHNDKLINPMKILW